MQTHRKSVYYKSQLRSRKLRRAAAFLNQRMNASRNRPVGSLRSATSTPGRVIRNVRRPHPPRAVALTGQGLGAPRHLHETPSLARIGDHARCRKRQFATSVRWGTPRSVSANLSRAEVRHTDAYSARIVNPLEQPRFLVPSNYPGLSHSGSSRGNVGGQNPMLAANGFDR